MKSSVLLFATLLPLLAHAKDQGNDRGQPRAALRDYKTRYQDFERSAQQRMHQLTRIGEARMIFDNRFRFRAADVAKVNRLLEELPPAAVGLVRIARRSGFSLWRQGEKDLAEQQLRELSEALFSDHPDLASAAGPIRELERTLHETMDHNYFERRSALVQRLKTANDQTLLDEALDLIGEIDHLATNKEIAKEVTLEGSAGGSTFGSVPGGLLSARGGVWGGFDASWKGYQLIPPASHYTVRIKDHASLRDGLNGPDDRTPIEARLIAEKLVDAARILQTLARRHPERADRIRDYLDHSRVVFVLPRASEADRRFMRNEFGVPETEGLQYRAGEFARSVQFTRAATDVSRLRELDVMSNAVADSLKAEADAPLERLLEPAATR